MKSILKNDNVVVASVSSSHLNCQIVGFRPARSKFYFSPKKLKLQTDKEWEAVIQSFIYLTIPCQILCCRKNCFKIYANPCFSDVSSVGWGILLYNKGRQICFIYLITTIILVKLYSSCLIYWTCVENRQYGFQLNSPSLAEIWTRNRPIQTSRMQHTLDRSATITALF